MRISNRIIWASVALVAGCAKLTAPSGDEDTGAARAQARVAEAATTTPDSEKPPAQIRRRDTPPPQPSAQAADAEKVRASHILIAYKGAQRAKPDVTRTKEEAKALAEQVDKKAKAGADFAALAREYSDGPSKPRGGDLGRFTKDRMVKSFADAAFALKPGEVSGVVETGFGYHVIKRTE